MDIVIPAGNTKLSVSYYDISSWVIQVTPGQKYNIEALLDWNAEADEYGMASIWITKVGTTERVYIYIRLDLYDFRCDIKLGKDIENKTIDYTLT